MAVVICTRAVGHVRRDQVQRGVSDAVMREFMRLSRRRFDRGLADDHVSWRKRRLVLPIVAA